jgi:hypothetical protein
LLALGVVALALFWFRTSQSRALTTARYLNRIFNSTHDQTNVEEADQPEVR